MTMTGIEKRFVNRQRKAQRNIRKVQDRLRELDFERIRDVLELGCGIGAVSAFLAEHYAMNVTGTDYDPQQIEIARSLHGQSDTLRFSIEDGSDLSFDDANFDLVLSQNVFHHIPAWDRAVGEIWRVLRRGGYFIWLDLAFPRIVTKLLGPVVGRYALYTFDDIKSAFDRIGFNEVFYERMLHGPFMHHHRVMRKTPIE